MGACMWIVKWWCLRPLGLSPLKLVGITLTFSSVIVVITAVISLWLKPAGEAKFEELFIDQRNLSEFDTLAPGRFQSQRTGTRVTYTEEIDEAGELQGVFISEKVDKPNSDQRLVVNAESGSTQVDAEGNRFLVLKNGTRYTGNPGEADYRVIEYEEYGPVYREAVRCVSKTAPHRYPNSRTHRRSVAAELVRTPLANFRGHNGAYYCRARRPS